MKHIVISLILILMLVDSAQNALAQSQESENNAPSAELTEIYTFSDQWRDSSLYGYFEAVVDTLVLINPRGRGAQITNQDTLLGAGIYRFKFRAACEFAFAWRISSHDKNRGTALIFQIESNGDLSLGNISWAGHFPLYSWYDTTQTSLITIPFSMSVEEWHEVEINDTAKAISISLDGQTLPFFSQEEFPTETFFSNIEHGYVGVGRGTLCDVSFYGLTFQTNDAVDPPIGRMALDIDLNVRNQSQSGNALVVRPGNTVAVDIVTVSGAKNISQFQATLKYDSQRVEFLKFETRDLMQTGNVLVEQSSVDEIRVGAALPGTFVPSNSGSLGEAHFKILQGFESTNIDLLDPQFDALLQDWSVGSQIALVQAQDTDFDQNGSIGFPDFILFVGHFGESQGDPNFETIFDLNNDGAVNFPDLILMVMSFGSSTE